jgi:hypothetical protein
MLQQLSVYDHTITVSFQQKAGPFIAPFSGLHFQVGRLSRSRGRGVITAGLGTLQPNVTGSSRSRNQQRPERYKKNNKEPTHEDRLQQG